MAIYPHGGATAAAADPTPGPQLVLDAPIRKVTLLEDRAQVAREGKMQLPEGSHRVRVAGISPVIADRSVVARGPAGLRVDEARVIRRWRIGVEEKPADAADLAAEHARLASKVRHEQDQMQVLERRRQMVEEATDLLLEGINRELPFAKVFVPQWSLDVESFLDALRGLDSAVLDNSHHLRELYSKLQVLDLRVRTTARVDQVLQTELELEVTVEKAGDHTLTIEYMLPCALWRPIHRATLTKSHRGAAGAPSGSGGEAPGNVPGASQVRFECEGAVWQATGEDWKDVDLFFSTARSTQRAEPPVLSDDRLRVQKKPDKKVDVQVREEVIATTGEGRSRESGDLPGVDDGGETRLLGASIKATIPSNGRLYRVPVFSFDTAADVDRISRPEKGPHVHLRSRQVNGSNKPILAGPVELLRDSGYVGRATAEFVAPTERFALGWGPEDALRVKRTVQERRETAKLTGRQTVIRTVELFLSNLGDQPATFRLEERIPVSEIENVSIELDPKETNPPARPDEQGIVGWNVALTPHGTSKIKLVYKISASSDVRGL